MSEGDFKSRERKPASKEPDYWTSAQLSEPARKLVDAEAKIARELGLKENLRQRLSDCVRLYIDHIQAASDAPHPKQAKVQRRLKEIKKAASKLRKFFTEKPKVAAARDDLKFFEEYRFAALNPGWKDVLSDDDLRGLQESAAKTYELLDRKSVYVDGIDVLVDGPNVQGNFGIDVTELCEKLDALCAFIDKQGKSKGGRPASEGWNSLMRSLAAIYEHATGKGPTVTENEHAAEVGERYSGRFIRMATLLDKATADSCNIEARPNSALGPALRRLLKARQNRRSKTR